MRISSSVAGTTATCAVAEVEQRVVQNGLWSPAPWVGIPVLPLPSWETGLKFHNFSVPQCLHLKNGDNGINFPGLLSEVSQCV